MKRRYIQQRDSYSCGPIALLNALKFFGAPSSWKNEGRFLRDTLADPIYKQGAPESHMDWAIREHFTFYRGPASLLLIDDHLRSGGGVILHLYNMNHRGPKTFVNHWAFLDGVSHSGQSFWAVNMHPRLARSILRKKTLEHYIGHGNVFDPWFLEGLKQQD